SCFPAFLLSCFPAFLLLPVIPMSSIRHMHCYRFWNALNLRTSDPIPIYNQLKTEQDFSL
ncbi:hypothetical protein, partial [Photobacterium ganghwense]|uniref:hypothetical protein n=1 Tax=Photobacterium ganghwense TaxID=320778 RepID=UPI001C2DD02A